MLGMDSIPMAVLRFLAGFRKPTIPVHATINCCPRNPSGNGHVPEDMPSGRRHCKYCGGDMGTAESEKKT